MDSAGEASTPSSWVSSAASTTTTARPPATEVDYSKFGGHGTISFGADGQMQNASNFLGLETNGGGLTVAWAEENSRDSVFEAMQRRETYATSGTRPIVRFFGGFGLPQHDLPPRRFRRPAATPAACRWAAP